MSFYVSGYVADEMLEPLNFLAKHMKRSKSFLVGDALKHYIAEKMEELEDEMDADEALKTWHDKSQRLYTGDEVKAFIRANCREG